jgi:hypothetical protein
MVSLAALALVCACGTTVPGGGRAAGDTSLGGNPAGGPAAVAPSGPSASAPGAGTARSGSTGGVFVAPGTAAPTSSSISPPGRSTAPITVGILGIKPVAAAASAAGFGTAQTLSPTQAFQAAAASYKGVIVGRKLRLVVAEIDPASSSYATDFQAACEAFTTDNRADVVLTADVIGYEPFSACIARAGLAQINTGYGSLDLDAYRRYPNLVNLSVADADRKMRDVIDDAVAAGTLSRTDVVGVVVEGCGFNARVFDRTVSPRLRAVGVTNVVRQDVDCVGSFAGLGNAGTQMASVVLRFNSAHVTKVLYVSNFEAALMLFFTKHAESQGYRPMYLLSSSAGPTTVIGDVPAGQRTGLTGSGTLVASDTTAGAKPVTPAQRSCFQAMAASGHPVASGSNVDTVAAYDACDAFGALAVALQASNGSSAGTTLRAALNAVSTRIRLAGNVDGLLQLTSSSPTGPVRSRHFAYSGSCDCIVYTRPERPL